MIYFTSDTHFSHDNILKFEPSRTDYLGNTIQEHDEKLLKMINSMVKPDDTLFILGDFGFGHQNGVKDCRSKINCRNVILILGNHDKHTVNTYLRCGFQAVLYEATLKIASEFVRLRHHPYKKSWFKALFWKEKDRNKRPENRGHFLLHGHIHSGGHRIEGGWVNKGRQIHIGVDANKYRVVTIKEVEAKISQIKNQEEKLFKNKVLSFLKNILKKAKVLKRIFR
jgi:calcineurin-like phosphoesterase family protein